MATQAESATEPNLELLDAARELENVPWCEEYEAMISGMPFDEESSPILKQYQLRSKWFCNEYNCGYVPSNMTPANVNNRRIFGLRKVLGKIGDGVIMERPISFSYGFNISLGSGVLVKGNLMISDCALVTIGNRVTIGYNVKLVTDAHRFCEHIGVYQYARPIKIEDGCFIGDDVIVLPGIKIGEGSKIESRSIVSEDIPEHSVAAGAPARIVRKRGISNVGQEEKGGMS